MSSRGRLHGVHLFVALLALLAAGASWAQGSGPQDLNEISSYGLTGAGLAKFAKASRNLAPLDAQSGSDCSGHDEESDANGQTIDQVVARLNARPGAQQAIQSAGMTTREYVVFSMAVFQAGMASWALSQPGGTLPPGVSMDNVNFYRKHEGELTALGQDKRSSTCSEEESGVAEDSLDEEEASEAEEMAE